MTTEYSLTIKTKESSPENKNFEIIIPLELFSIMENFNGMSIGTGESLKIISGDKSIMFTPEFLEDVLKNILNPFRFFIEKMLILYKHSINTLNEINEDMKKNE